ncbi:hypothetical protein CEXT_724091 [Caerostris extrusa]|uniref:Uncharacterized protein n=1 Tax=Caerostris extrusa TaxID=172846 RepID=A0AAV4QRV7_CAEEX|nr:hypothetical protein CEXT_724091 [Caerostris extrusa]
MHTERKTSNFKPKLEEPYIITTQRSPVSYRVANLDSRNTPIEIYHVLVLKPFMNVETTQNGPLYKREEGIRKVMSFPLRVVTWQQKWRL